MVHIVCANEHAFNEGVFTELDSWLQSCYRDDSQIASAEVVGNHPLAAIAVGYF